VGKLQWCSGWTKGHAEAVDIGRKKCDACGDKVLSFGLPTEEEARWGGGCVKGARGGGDGRQEEVRGLLTEAAKFWTAGGGEKVKARWCGGCAKVHVGAVQVGSKKGRGWPAAAAKLWTVGGGEGAEVLWLGEGARGGGGRRAAARARRHERQGCTRKR